jgi:hypothetical protein
MSDPFNPSTDELQIRDLELSVRGHNTLRGGGVETVAQLMEKSAAELLRMDNLGRVTLNEIIAVLNAMGLQPRCQTKPPPIAKGLPMKKVVVKALSRGFLVEWKHASGGHFARDRSQIEAYVTLEKCMDRVRELLEESN